MYVIQILNKITMKTVGPTFFTGRHQEYPKLTDGMIAAQRWIKEEGLKPADHKIIPRIVGCL